MRDTLELKYRQVPRIADLFGAEPSTVCLVPGASVLAPSRLLFPELATPEVVRQHLLREPASEIRLSAVPGVVVAQRSVVSASGVTCLLGDPVPAYVDMFLRDGMGPADAHLPPRPARRLTGISVLLTHWNSSIYGHWLLEGVPKLFLLRHYRGELPQQLRIVVPSICADLVRAWCDVLLPDIPVESFDEGAESLLCEHLLLPSWLGGPRHHYHPLLGELVAAFLNESGTAGMGRRLYISRERENPYRALANRSEVEDIAERSGFLVIMPEKLSVLEQIRTFGGADLLIGPFGSSMHNAIFSPAGATICCINWVNSLQSKIAHLRYQSVGYILPSPDGGIAYDRADPRVRSFTIAPEVIRFAIERITGG